MSDHEETGLLRPKGNMKSSLSQVVLLSCVCFCVPGMWNSITSMAGGIEDTAAASLAIAWLYGCFAVFSLIAPVVNNTLGSRVTLFLGSLGYLLYVASLWAYPLTGPTFVVVAGAVNGVGAALLWTAQGALIMSYPSKETKGIYLSYFWIIFNLGAVMGGLLTFALNFDKRPGDAETSASSSTFAVFFFLMLIGAVASLFLVSPDRVVRPDGTVVQSAGDAKVTLSMASVGAEILGMLSLFSQPRMLALAPLFIYSNWFYSYQFSCFNATLFTVRTQGLNNAFYWGAQMVGAYFLGKYLDDAKRPLRRRALNSIAMSGALVGLSWIAGAYVQYAYHIDDRKCTGSSPAEWCSSKDILAAKRLPAQDVEPLDVGNFGPVVAPGLVYLLFGLCDAFVQCWSYWLLGHLDESSAALSRSAGFYKGLQSAGGAVSWSLSSGKVRPSVQLYVRLACSSNRRRASSVAPTPPLHPLSLAPTLLAPDRQVNIALFMISFPLAGVLVSRSTALGQSPRDPKSVKQ